MFKLNISSIMDSHDIPVTECLLDSGGIARYDLAVSISFCKEENYTADNNVYEYLGEGVSYSVNGVLQNGTIKNRYWRKR